MIVLATKDTTVCTGFLLYVENILFTDSAIIDTSVWVRFVDTNTQRGGSHSVHTNIFTEAGETYYVNPLMEKAIAMKWIKNA